MEWADIGKWCATVGGALIVVIAGQWYNHYRIERREAKAKAKAALRPPQSAKEMLPNEPEQFGVVTRQEFNEARWSLGNVFYVYGVLFCAVLMTNSVAFGSAQMGLPIRMIRVFGCISVVGALMGGAMVYPFGAPPHKTLYKRTFAWIAVAGLGILGIIALALVSLVHPPYASSDYFFRIFSKDVTWYQESRVFNNPTTMAAATQPTTGPSTTPTVPATTRSTTKP